MIMSPLPLISRSFSFPLSSFAKADRVRLPSGFFPFLCSDSGTTLRDFFFLMKDVPRPSVLSLVHLGFEGIFHHDFLRFFSWFDHFTFVQSPPVT